MVQVQEFNIFISRFLTYKAPDSMLVIAVTPETLHLRLRTSFPRMENNKVVSNIISGLNKIDINMPQIRVTYNVTFDTFPILLNIMPTWHD